LRFLPSPLAGEGGAFLVSFIDKGEGRGTEFSIASVTPHTASPITEGEGNSDLALLTLSPGGRGGAPSLVFFIDEGEGRGKKGANVLVRGRFASRDDRKREEFRLFLPLPTAGEGSAFLVGFIEEGEGEGEGEGKGDVATGYGVIGRPFSQRASK